MNREWNKTRKKHRRSDRTWVNLQSYSLSYRTTPASSRKSEISVLIQMSNSIALLVVYYTIMHSSYITYLYSSGGGHLVWKFLPTSYFIIGFGSFKLLNKILVIRSLKTVCNFCYLTKYERFRHFFYFIEIARFWWVLAKKCKKLFLFIIKFTTKVDLTGVSKINSSFANGRQSWKTFCSCRRAAPPWRGWRSTLSPKSNKHAHDIITSKWCFLFVREAFRRISATESPKIRDWEDETSGQWCYCHAVNHSTKMFSV